MIAPASAGGVQGGAGRVVAGVHAVRAALDAGQRLSAVVLADGRGGRAEDEVVRAADRAGVPVRRAPRRELDRLAGGAHHQGVIGQAPPYSYADLSALARGLQDAGERGLVLALDGVQDPGNLGAVLRSAAAFGAAGVVIPGHGACEVTLATERAAVGAAARVPVARVTNLGRAVDYLKETGSAWVATADAHGGLDPAHPSTVIPRPLVLVLGGEAKGVRPGLARRADLSLTVPLAGDVESLNVSVAAAVLMYALRAPA